MSLARFPNSKLPKKLESQIKYLLTPKVSDRFMMLFNKRASVSKIAQGCAVSEQAIRIAFPELDFSKRSIKKKEENKE